MIRGGLIGGAREMGEKGCFIDDEGTNEKDIKQYFIYLFILFSCLNFGFMLGISGSPVPQKGIFYN